jgi:hypothetical protein
VPGLSLRLPPLFCPGPSLSRSLAHQSNKRARTKVVVLSSTWIFEHHPAFRRVSRRRKQMQEAGRLKPLLSLNKGHIRRTFHCRRTPEVGTGATLLVRSAISHLFIASAILLCASLSLSRGDASTHALARSPPIPTRSRSLPGKSLPINSTHLHHT